MTQLEIGICARLTVYELLLEILFSSLMVSDPNREQGFALIRKEIMDAVQYRMQSGGDPGDFGLVIQTEAIKVAEIFLERVASKMSTDSPDSPTGTS